MKQIQKYEDLCNELVDIFAEKQELDFEFWITEIGGAAYFSGEFVFSFLDIIYDLKNNCEKGKIIEWFCHDMEHNQDKAHEDRIFIDYESYLEGKRHRVD